MGAESNYLDCDIDERPMPENDRQLLTFSDHISIFKMDCLTAFGQSVLPPGHWDGQKLINLNADSRSLSPLEEGKKRIFLTFDDGPNPKTTPALLDLLADEGARATFFIIGRNVERYPVLAREIAARGHGLGSHSFNHLYLPILDLKNMQSEIVRTNDVFQDQVGGCLKLFRPPYGILDKRGADILRELGMEIVYWTAVPEDWQSLGANRVAQRVVPRLADGQLIVLHEGADIADQTIEATRQIIRRGKSKGFHFQALAS